MARIPTPKMAARHRWSAAGQGCQRRLALRGLIPDGSAVPAPTNSPRGSVRAIAWLESGPLITITRYRTAR